MVDQPHSRPPEPAQSQPPPIGEDWPLTIEQLEVARKTHTLDLAALDNDTQARKSHLYSQVIDVLAQLRSLEFNEVGSLYPGLYVPPDVSLDLLPDLLPGSGAMFDPVICSLQTAQNSALYTMTQRQTSAPKEKLSSAVDYAMHRYRGLVEAAAHPVASKSLLLAQMDEYALHDVKTHIIGMVASTMRCQERFVLTHADLRWTNILVDDDLNVKGIIDWDWTRTIPQSLFMPPTWLSQCSPDIVTSVAYRHEYKLFYAVLTSMAADVTAAQAWPNDLCTTPIRNLYQTLEEEWGPDLPTKDFRFPLTVILERHHLLTPTYFFAIFPKLFQPYLLPRDYLPEFYAVDENRGGALSKAMRARHEKCTRYTEHLKANGLHTEIALSDASKEWLRKRAAVNIKRLNNYRGLGSMGSYVLEAKYDSTQEKCAETVLLDSLATWDMK